MYIHLYSEAMKTIQCTHSLHHRNGFVATCRLWTTIGGVHALLVLEPTWWSGNKKYFYSLFIASRTLLLYFEDMPNLIDF